MPIRSVSNIQRTVLVGCVLAAMLGAAIPDRSTRGQDATVRVSNSAELLSAMASAVPGQTILLVPADSGEWTLPHKMVIDRAGSADAPITVRSDRLGVPSLHLSPEGGIVEGFLVNAPHWRFENLDLVGACPREQHGRCEHAFHIVGAADHTVVRNSRMEGFNAQIKGNGLDVGGGRQWPDDVVIEGNELYNRLPRNTGNPVTPVDVVGGRRWVVRANYIHDFAKAGGNRISYAAFLKGNSRDGIMERNLVVCEQLHRGQIRLGLSLGGGGSSPDRICEDGTCTPEHQGGVLRNNIIAHCPADVGIYLNEAADSHVLHNLLYDTGGGVDVRFAASNVTLRANLMSGRIRERDGGSATSIDNLENLTPDDFDRWYRDPDGVDFRLLNGHTIVDWGTPLDLLPDDFCGNARSDDTPDLGPIEYDDTRGCETTHTHPDGAVQQPTATDRPEPTGTPTATRTPRSDETPSATPTIEPTATATERPTVDPSITPPVDIFLRGTIYAGSHGGAPVSSGLVQVIGCDGSIRRIPIRASGEYFDVVGFDFADGCEEWPYRITAPGFLPHTESVPIRDALEKDFVLTPAGLYLPRLLND